MKNPFILFIILLLFSLQLSAQATCLSCPGGPAVATHPIDSLVLVNLYQRNGGTSWSGTSWDLSCRVCNWSGIELDANGRVQRIRLNGRNLTGSLSDSLGLLSELDVLEMRSNSLSGGIPDSLVKCRKLLEVDLQENNLTGGIPTYFKTFPLLQEIWLSRNNIGGGQAFPAWISQVDSLRVLGFDDCGFSGSIPDSLGQLRQLRRLQLSNNNFTGTIPDSLGNCLALEELFLGGNDLVGPIPTALQSLSRLEEFSLTANFNFAGGAGIPTWLNSWTQLKTLGLNNCSFAGPIPASLGQLSQLEWLDLGNNGLTGVVPAAIGQLPCLRYLRLFYNELSGFAYLNGLTELTQLIIAHNKMASLPAMGQLQRLERLYVNSNQLTSLPSLDSLANLRHLYVYRNLLTRLPRLDRLNQLTRLWCSFQAIEELPSLDSLQNLEFLACSYTQIDSVPSLDALGQLEELYLTHNPNLKEVPSLDSLQQLRILDFGFCAIRSLPRLRFLRQLEVLDVRNNWLESLPSLDSLRMLLGLYAGYNLLRELPSLANNLLLQELEVPMNNVTALPPLNPLVDLDRLQVNGNLLRTLPDLSQVSLKYLRADLNELDSLPAMNLSEMEEVILRYNHLCFDDLLPFLPLGLPANKFSYEVQANYQLYRDSVGGDVLLCSPCQGDEYLWYKDGNRILSTQNPSADSACLRLSNASVADSGIYTLGVKDARFPGLSIWAYPFDLCNDRLYCDTNGDGYCDLSDLQSVAVKFRTIGPRRDSCGQPAAAWQDSLFAQDLRMSDVNGDGVINYRDTLGVATFGQPIGVTRALTLPGTQRLGANVTDSLLYGEGPYETRHTVTTTDSLKDVAGVLFVREIYLPEGYDAIGGYHDPSGFPLLAGASETFNYTQFFFPGSIEQSGATISNHARIEVLVARADGTTVDLAPGDGCTECIIRVEPWTGKNETLADTIPVAFQTYAYFWNAAGDTTVLNYGVDVVTYYVGNPVLNPEVELQASLQGQQARLDWQMEPVGQVGTFHIQRALPGEAFMPLVSFSTEELDAFAYLDPLSQSGTYQYQLVFEDEAGNTYPSNTCELVFQAPEKPWRVGPNPLKVGESLWLRGAEKILQGRWIDLRGQVVLEFGESNQLPSPERAGLYFLQLHSSHHTQTIKIQIMNP